MENNMNRSSYTRRLASSLISNLNNGTSTVFLRCYSPISLFKEDVLDKINGDNVRVLSYEFNINEIQGAYAPLLKWIKEIYDDEYKCSMSIADFVDRCNVYSLHRQMFMSYLECERCIRYEDIIFPEVNYERMRLNQTFRDIFSFVTNDKKLYFILEDINYASDSFLNFIGEYLKCDDNNIGIIATFNELNNHNVIFKESWNKLCDILMEKNILYDIENVVHGDIVQLNDSNLVFNETLLKEYKVMFESMLNMLAFEQAVSYEQLVHEDILKSVNSYNYRIVFRIIMSVAIAAVYGDNLDRAIELYNTISTFFSTDVYKEFNGEFYYLASIISMHQLDCEDAIRMAELCREAVELKGDDFASFKADVLYYKAHYCGWHEMFFAQIFSIEEFEQRVELPDALVYKMIEYGFYNTLAYFYIYCFEFDGESMTKIAESLQESGYLKKALDIAYELDNMSFVASAYMKKILDYSVDDCRYYEYISFLHKRRTEILKNVKIFSLDEFRYDHLGYQCIIHERYTQAHMYFNDYLLWVYEQQRIDKIAETLYNMATNAMVARQYYMACRMLITTIKIIEYAKVQSLCICKASKLYGMLALCYYYLEEEISCSLYVDKIERMVSHLLDSESPDDYLSWDDELFLYYFLKALLHKKNNNISAAQICFSKAEYHMYRAREYMFFSYPLLSFEKADMYYSIGENKKGDKTIDACIEFCSRNGYVKRAMELSNKKNNNSYHFEEYNFELKGITFANIIEQARRSEVNIKREARRKNISFLSDWQEIINKETNNFHQITYDAMNSLKLMYKLDGVLYFDIVKGKPHVIYCNEEAEMGINYLDEIYEFFKICDNNFSTNRAEKAFSEYKSVIQYFNMSNIMVFVGIPLIDNEEISSVFIGFINKNDLFGYNDFMIDDSELEVIKFVLIQLSIGINKIKKRKELEKINRKLYDMAIKDQLTGLLNRQGFERKLESVFTKPVFSVLLMYLDLDNFKYYNDTFGHDIGDIVLKKFARVLIESTDDKDIVVRYGGDEFIIMLINKDDYIGEKIAGVIAKELSSGFIDEIRDKCGQDIEIPPNKLLSCSIGISNKDKCSLSDINSILLQADEALYYIKDNMKGTCISWEDLHE